MTSIKGVYLAGAMFSFRPCSRKTQSAILTEPTERDDGMVSLTINSLSNAGPDEDVEYHLGKAYTEREDRMFLW